MSDTDTNVNDAESTISEKKPVRKPAKPVTNDAEEAISVKGSVLLMTSAGGSWTTPSGVTFNKSRPYQLVPTDEIESLLASGRFRRAEPSEVQEFYKIEL